MVTLNIELEEMNGNGDELEATAELIIKFKIWVSLLNFSNMFRGGAKFINFDRKRGRAIFFDSCIG